MSHDEAFSEEEKDARRRIHDAIQEGSASDEAIEDAVLVGFVVVAEWSDPEGERWLSTISGSAGGEDAPPRWVANGYLHHALYKWDG